MPFLSPKQQRQSTEGKLNSLVVHLLWLMTVTSEATQH